MNIYLTSGTMDFMESLRKKYENEMMIVMHGAGTSVLLHETNKESVFQTPRRYKVITESGNLQEEQGYFAFTHIPVTDEGRPIFEHEFRTRVEPIENEVGFIAYRLLRPINSDTYLIITQWTSVDTFKVWKSSSTYKHLHADNESGIGLDKGLHMFSSASYITTYRTTSEQEKNDKDDEEVSF